MPARLLVVSPHCDDAVFACGDFLAAHRGALVVTVFAGPPAPGTELTPWDAACGFRASAEAADARRGEDRRALALLHAEPLWLDFRDAQYGPSPADDEVARALAAVVERHRPHTIVLPLGLFHSDHRLVHRAGLALLDRCGSATLWYEDALYRRMPGLVVERLAAMRRAGLRPRRAMPAWLDRASVRKRWAVHCYRSQLRALATPGRLGVADAFEQEALWRVER